VPQRPSVTQRGQRPPSVARPHTGARRLRDRVPCPNLLTFQFRHALLVSPVLRAAAALPESEPVQAAPRWPFASPRR
jgi:hypothetical protein